MIAEELLLPTPTLTFFHYALWPLLTGVIIVTHDFQYYHKPGRLMDKQIATLSDLSNVTHMNEILDNICVVRIVGTPEHMRVREVRKEQRIFKF